MYGICIYFFIHPRMEACFVKIRVLDQMCSQRILIDHVHELCRVHLIKMQKFNFTHMPILLTPLAGAPYFGVASLNLLRATWHMLVPEQLELFF